MQAGMIDLLKETQKPRVFNIVITPLGDLAQVIFCRKIAGQHGWQAGKTHYCRIDTPSWRRAMRASVIATSNRLGD